jgi:signal transduction histidine kinase
LHERLDREPPRAVAETAYRIIQEALTNVRKHAQAAHVTITLEKAESELSVTVADDGVGFDTGRLGLPRPGHLGATAMRERAALIDGRCEIASTPERGTTVTLHLPVPQEPEETGGPG